MAQLDPTPPDPDPARERELELAALRAALESSDAQRRALERDLRALLERRSVRLDRKSTV